MVHLENAAQNWVPKTKAERDAVFEQLNRMVASPLFSHSKRYPVFLRYVVEQAFTGKVEQLKERTLGLEVFHRSADYDPSSDPVVRFTAGEIRKRIAQYYFQPGHDMEIRIDIPSGSYIPEFRLPDHHPIADPAVSTLNEEPPSLPLVRAVPVPSPASNHAMWLAAVLLVLALISIVTVRQKPWVGQSALNQFWGPVISSHGRVLLCVSTEMDLPSPLDQKSSQIPLYEVDRWMNRLDLADATTLSKMTAILYSNGKDYRVEGDKSVTLGDLRQGPVVLIGALDNDWTTRLTKDLRFSFSEGDTPAYHKIKDRLHPDRNDWVINGNAPYVNVAEDYAVVARYRDQTTGTIVIVAGGLGEYGTIAAGEVLSDDTYFKEIIAHAPRNWERINMEAIISTQVINGQSGPPRVLETYFW